jgi:hypothetical protein
VGSCSDKNNLSMLGAVIKFLRQQKVTANKLLLESFLPIYGEKHST